MKENAKKTTLALLCLFFVFSLAFDLSAQPVRGDMPSKDVMKERLMQKKEELMAELDLTPEQKEELESLREKNQQEVKDLFQSMRDKRAQLAGELEEYESDSAAIEKTKSELKGILGTMVDKRVEGVLQMKEVLNEEQYGKFVEKTQEFKEKWKKKMRSRFSKRFGRE